MKTIHKAGLAATLLAVSSAASADLTANVGFASEYIFRGIPQKTSSASAGLDYETGGFYVGTWTADVGDGIEVDVYGGYGFGITDAFSLSIGATGYFYTGDFDDDYKEINLGAAYDFTSANVALDVAVGRYDNFDGPTLDYTYWALTVGAENGLYGTVAGFAQDFEGEYLELGYGTSVAEIDLGVALIFANSDLVGESSEEIVFTIGKTFDLK